MCENFGIALSWSVGIGRLVVILAILEFKCDLYAFWWSIRGSVCYFGLLSSRVSLYDISTLRGMFGVGPRARVSFRRVLECLNLFQFLLVLHWCCRSCKCEKLFSFSILAFARFVSQMRRCRRVDWFCNFED